MLPCERRLPLTSPAGSGRMSYWYTCSTADVSALLPPPGFRATVRGGASFRAFLKDAARPGAHQAQVEYPPNVTQTVLARVTQEGLAFVLVAGTPIQERLAAIVAGSPLLAALLHAENRKRVAEGEAAVARAAGRRANDLANALDSARLELEHALGESARLNRELQENDRRKDEFLAMLGHELRNPLAAIRGALEVMRFSKRRGARSPGPRRRRSSVRAADSPGRRLA